MKIMSHQNPSIVAGKQAQSRPRDPGDSHEKTECSSYLVCVLYKRGFGTLGCPALKGQLRELSRYL